MKVQLLTRDRKLVARFSIPEFNPGPEIITWGIRSFIRADEELMDVLDERAVLQHKQRITNYTEGMNYHIMAGIPKWDVPEENSNGG